MSWHRGALEATVLNKLRKAAESGKLEDFAAAMYSQFQYSTVQDRILTAYEKIEKEQEDLRIARKAERIENEKRENLVQELRLIEESEENQRILSKFQDHLSYDKTKVNHFL